MMEAAIVVSNVTKSFEMLTDQHRSIKSALISFRRSKPQRLLAVKDVDFSINKGETVAIIGRNGSGKSTLLRVIGRVYKPTEGRVEIDGRMATMLDWGAGFHPELSGRENIFFYGAILGLTTPQIKERVDKIINFAELSEFIDAPVRTYSKGMLMRLGFSIAVGTDPDILLIDEVLVVGDAEFEEKCYDRIEAFKSTGRTIVFVTHDLEAARSVASRTIWIDKGVVRADGETQEVVNLYLSTIPKHEHHASREVK